jgi:excinuclease ABC subunit C
MKKSKTSSDLQLFLDHLTPEPGVYRMISAQEEVLYVGKAANLKKRVSSYFTKQNVGPKTRSLINQIASIQVSVTRSETEALLLESSLIKSLKPKYNVVLRDDKSYPYLHVSEGNFPRIEVLRFKKKPKKGLYFGPYPSVYAVRETLSVIQKVFKIRGCAESYFNARSRPCLQFQIKRCSAPCTQLVDIPTYQQSIKDALRFLEGKSQDIINELAEKMESAVEKLEFEDAARMRDQIKSLRLIQEQQGIVQLRGDADIIAIEAKPGFACVQCVTIRSGEILVSNSFFPQVPENSFEELEDYDLWQQVFSAFIAHFYIDTPERIPALIITNHPIIDLEAITKMLSNLRGKACKIQTKPRGVKSRWFDFAQNNLQIALTEKASSNALITQRYTDLATQLHLSSNQLRLECFDISHTQGSSTVASCVVFDEKGPAKSQYRRFNIKGIQASDDYAAMEQVLRRRYKHTQLENMPDLVIIDGGKGQLSVAKKVFAELGVTQVNLLGIAKGPTRKAGWEQIIFVQGDYEKEVKFSSHAPGLHLLQHIRDEAHRFAITFHRQKRQKLGLDSTLETIEGVGNKRRQALLKRFGGLRELSRASVAEIAKVSGISENLANKIYQHFHHNAQV